MKIFGTIKKFGIDLFFYFSKGARVDVALIKAGRMRTRTGYDYLKPGAMPIMENGKAIGYDVNDRMMGFSVLNKAILKLKNNSKNYAYNVQILNGKEIFSEFTNLTKLTSIAPNESLEMEVAFSQDGYFENGMQADELPDIPADIENSILKIQYENEAGTKFITKFWVSFNSTINEYSYNS